MTVSTWPLIMHWLVSRRWRYIERGLGVSHAARREGGEEKGNESLRETCGARQLCKLTDMTSIDCVGVYEAGWLTALCTPYSV
jgi:hypothetical protein